MFIKELPSDWKFYADLMIKVIETSGLITRLALSKEIETMLEKEGYNWDRREKVNGKINYKNPYYRISSAINEIKKGSSNREPGTWKGMVMEKRGSGKNTVYNFLKGIDQTTKQMSMTEKLEVSELPIGLTKKVKKKSTINSELPDHVSTNNYNEISDLLNSGEHLLLTGIPGIGKTWNAKYWGLKNNYKIFKVVLTRESAEWQLLGRSNLILTYVEIKSYASSKDPDCVRKCDFEKVSCKAVRRASIEIMRDTWVDGEFTQAVRHAAAGNKTMLIVDEVNFGDQSVVAGSLNSILEDQKEPDLTIKDTGENIVFNRKHFRCVVTMNPGTSGTNPLNEAFEDRFVIVPCELPENWEDIVYSQVGKLPSDGIIKVFIQIRDSNTVRKTVALRSAIKWTRLEKSYGEIAGSKKLQKLIINQFKDNDKKIVREIIKGVFK